MQKNFLNFTVARRAYGYCPGSAYFLYRCAVCPVYAWPFGVSPGMISRQ